MIINTNEAKVFDALQAQWPFPVTRPHLVQLTQIPRSTIYDCLARLELQGRVVSFALKAPRPGRPRTFYFSVPLEEEEFHEAQWARVKQAQQEINGFFAALVPSSRIYCVLLTSDPTHKVRFGEIQSFCQKQCGMRIQCIQDNRSED